MKKNLVFSITLLLLAVLVAAAPYSFAKVCDVSEKVMKCLCGNSKYLRLGLDAGIIANAAGIILFPTLLIGVCGMPSMHCHSVTQPTLIVLGILLLAVSAVDTVLSLRSRN